MHVNKNKLPPETDPKYSQPKSLPVQQNILPYKKPDGHQTPADKMHTAFNMRRKGQILIQKHNNRCLCSPSTINTSTSRKNEQR